MCWLHMKFVLSLPGWVVITPQIHFSHGLSICWPNLAIISHLTPLNRTSSALFRLFFHYSHAWRYPWTTLAFSKNDGVKASYWQLTSQAPLKLPFSWFCIFSGLNKDAVTNILIHVN